MYYIFFSLKVLYVGLFFLCFSRVIRLQPCILKFKSMRTMKLLCVSLSAAKSCKELNTIYK